MTVLEWLLRDRTTGEVRLGQAPNLPVLVFSGATLARWLFPDDTGPTTAIVQSTSITWWAVDELLRGVNPARRILGAVTLIVAVPRLFARIR